MGLKKLAVKLRKTVKIAVILTVATIIILGLIQIFYKQTYSVSLNGEVIGYTNNKIELQEKINNYLKNGNGDGASFVEIKNLPTYKVCLLKKGISTNDGEIYEKVISSGISYYKYYAITVKDEEKSYVATFSDAEEAVKQLKDKNSNNSSELGIVEKYGVKNLPEGVKIASDDDIDEDEDDEDSEEDENDGTEKTIKISEVPEISSVDDTVNKVYEKPVINVSKTKENTSAYKQVAKTVVSETSKGLDIAAPRGTAIKAAASGTVIFAGSGAPYSGYGNVVVIQSTSSVTIRYGHCSALYVKKGESVVQGQVIAAVGSTGISTGNHLHFEIRYNGKAVNPQNYVYK